MSLDLVEMALTAEHEDLIRKARTEPRAANGAAVKRLKRFVTEMLRQHTEYKLSTRVHVSACHDSPVF